MNLVKQTGREKVIINSISYIITSSLSVVGDFSLFVFLFVKLVGDAFEHHILLLDNPHLTYLTFDFHQS